MIKILIVEDDEKLRNLYTEMLSSEGYKVVSVCDAMGANLLLRDESFDIMLLDIKLPRVHGSILSGIMQMFHKNVKIVVASAYPIEEQKKMIERAADYYDKAQSIEVLIEKIKRQVNSIMAQGKILIIEDELKIRRIFRSQLEELGYRIFEAEDGELGMKLLTNEPGIGLVILDIALPKVIGTKVFESIKNQFPLMKIIVASVFPTDDQKSLIHGADDYFDKSEDVNVLVEKVGRLFSATSHV
jgi:DNA-binding response OmpR family regulator